MRTPLFTITPAMNSAIARIERLRTIVERSRILPSREVVLRRRAAIEATRSSTGIEGNPLSEREVERAIAGKHKGTPNRFVTEVVNYKKALALLEVLSREKNPFTTKNILVLHRLTMARLLPKEKTGEFRKTPIYVVDIVGGKDILRYTGPEASDVPGLIGELLEWLGSREDLHPILVAGILHFAFVSIHPFSDGNGRVTRLLTLLYLYTSGYGFRQVLVPDSFYFSDRRRYYTALNRGKTYVEQMNADMTPWLEYFVGGFLQSAEDLTEKITSVSLSGDHGDVVTLTPDDYRIVDYIGSIGKAGISDLVSALELPKRTIQRRIKYLTENGVIKRVGKGPASRYLL